MENVLDNDWKAVKLAADLPFRSFVVEFLHRLENGMLVGGGGETDLGCTNKGINSRDADEGVEAQAVVIVE